MTSVYGVCINPDLSMRNFAWSPGGRRLALRAEGILSVTMLLLGLSCKQATFRVFTAETSLSWMSTARISSRILRAACLLRENSLNHDLRH